MGLLDDAIREHLQLKRRHGANPEEVERQEREVLGASRRGEFAPPPESDPAAPFDADEPTAASAPEPYEAPEFDDRTRVAGEVPRPGEEAGAPGYDEDTWLEEERDQVPSEESLDLPKPAEEDVLEET